MGKLLGHQIKNHFKNNWFIPLLPLIFFMVGLAFNYINISWADTSLSISVLSIPFGYMAAIITVIVGDYNMFFGEEGLFYESISLSPVAKTFSRLFYYLIMFFIYSIFMAALFLLIMLPSGQAMDFASIQGANWTKLMSEINKVGTLNISILCFWCLVLLIRSIAKIIFSISAGGGKILKRFGFGATVIVYIVISFVESVIISFMNNLNLLSNIKLYMANGDIFIRGTGISFLIFILIEAPLFIYGVYYLHKNRISVN
ncbi:hypothetical protein [Peptoniphilus catoniae]|uniref:hypothetical protein n=1 Tax=Peptoniphilus catoniae TaxID=1660341 RepID=UPI0010FE83F8|nr:hypothetical protein [Peptoniphilus catoniae]